MPNHRFFGLALVALFSSGCFIGISGPKSPSLLPPQLPIVKPATPTPPPPPWEIGELSVGANVLAVRMLSAEVACGVGEGGVMVTTVDGGRTWSDLPHTPAIKDDLQDVVFLDPRWWWAIGDKAAYVTKDAGATWTTVDVFKGEAPTIKHSEAGPAVVALAFRDYEHGAVAGHGRVYLTNDSGATWTPVEPVASLAAYLNVQPIGQAYTVTHAEGFGRVDGSGIAYTPAQAVATTPAGLPVTFRTLRFAGPLVGYAVAEVLIARGTAHCQLLKTVDGGLTWVVVANRYNDDPLMDAARSIDVVDERHVYIVTSYTVLGSSDGGATFTSLQSRVHHPWGLDMWDDATGLLFGQGAVFRRVIP
ncbi:MAG: uncharacterized protein JWM80_5176 [Cyanobacteria bacterium RYN_339]|nr:uncharacterized protein [Cyanobacteria bacterium RYN_339]